MNFNIEKPANKFFYLLILTDIMFILLDLFQYATRYIDSPLFYIHMDFGYAEVFQYMKEYWIVILLLIITYKRKKLIYFSWSLIFLYILLDDSLQLHETMGAALVDLLGLRKMYGLRDDDIGELIFSILSGIVLFSFLGFLYIKSEVEAKKISNNLLVLFFILVFFGVLVDMLGQIFHGEGSIFRGLVNKVFTLIEDGGEMIVMSVIVWYLFKLEPTSDQVMETSLYEGMNRKK